MQPPVPKAERDQALRMLAMHQALQRRRVEDPALWYVPHAGQLRAHQARQRIRVLTPGNRFGKTFYMGAEADMAAMHRNPHRPTPPHPVVMIWFEKLKTTFDIVRDTLERQLFGTKVRWMASDEMYLWPDGSRMYLGSADTPTAWLRWMGIEVDKVYFNEEPPRPLFREMYMRQGVTRQAELNIAATAVTGVSWIEEELFTPWLEHHRKLGLSEADAVVQQRHPSIFFLPYGGHADNPHLPAAVHESLDQSRWGSEGEKRVRMRGGFARFGQRPVFDPEAVELLTTEAKHWAATTTPAKFGLPAVE